jgi:hypothetical protein
VWSAEREWIWAPYMETEVGWRGRARTVAEPCGEAVDAHDIGL